jgi:hypothetical protein
LCTSYIRNLPLYDIEALVTINTILRYDILSFSTQAAFYNKKKIGAAGSPKNVMPVYQTVKCHM